MTPAGEVNSARQRLPLSKELSIQGSPELLQLTETSQIKHAASDTQSVLLAGFGLSSEGPALAQAVQSHGRLEKAGGPWHFTVTRKEW